MENVFGRSGECTDKKWDTYLHINNFGMYKLSSVLRPRGRQDYQMIIISEGEGKFVFDGEEKTLRVGDGVLYKPGEPQIYSFDKDSEYFWFHFSGTEAPSILQRLEYGETLIRVNRLDVVKEIFGQMLNCTASKEESEDMLCGLFMILLSKIKTEKSKIDEHMLKVINHIKSESFNGLTLSEYAEMAKLSKYHFLRKFKAITGTTPKSYKAGIITEKAKDILQNTDLNVSETANVLGFDDGLYFSRFFKKNTGKSPKEYRESLGL